jgi:hypothetical protein
MKVSISNNSTHVCQCVKNILKFIHFLPSLFSETNLLKIQLLNEANQSIENLIQIFFWRKKQKSFFQTVKVQLCTTFFIETTYNKHGDVFTRNFLGLRF